MIVLRREHAFRNYMNMKLYAPAPTRSRRRTVFCNPQGLEPALLPLRQLRGLEVTVLPVRRSLDGRVVCALTVCQLRGLKVTVLTVRL